MISLSRFKSPLIHFEGSSDQVLHGGSLGVAQDASGKWVFPKIVVPQNGWFIMVPTPMYKWMIWGVINPPLFLVQHPNEGLV